MRDWGGRVVKVSYIPPRAYSLYHITALPQLAPKLKVGRVVLTPMPVCCIYHAPKQNIDDSSSESDSSSDSDSDSSGADDGSARPVGGAKRGRAKKHKHGDECGKRKPSPNAYEKMPKVKPRGGGEVEKK